jgi:hypothetical protein
MNVFQVSEVGEQFWQELDTWLRRGRMEKDM